MTLPALPTVDVECIARTSDNVPIAGAVFAFQLDKPDRYQGFVVPQRVLVTTDADGRAVAKVFPNALGSAGSVYQVEASYPGTPARRFLQGSAKVSVACRLDDVLVTEKLPDLGPVLTALRQLQAATAQLAADRSASQAAATLVQQLLAGIGAAGMTLHAPVTTATASIALAPGINVVGVRYQGGPVTLTLSSATDAYFIANLEDGAPGPVLPIFA